MPRRQRFKPSRKPKPAIEPSESEMIPASNQPPTEAMSEVRAEQAEERVPR